MAFPEEDIQNVVYRLAVQTDLEGRVLTIHFIGLRGDNIVLNWTIPVEATTASVSLIKPAAQGVELASPQVGEKDAEVAENDNRVDEERSSILEVGE